MWQWCLPRYYVNANCSNCQTVINASITTATVNSTTDTASCSSSAPTAVCQSSCRHHVLLVHWTLQPDIQHHLHHCYLDCSTTAMSLMGYRTGGSMTITRANGQRLAFPCCNLVPPTHLPTKATSGSRPGASCCVSSTTSHASATQCH